MQTSSITLAPLAPEEKIELINEQMSLVTLLSFLPQVGDLKAADQFSKLQKLKSELLNQAQA